jgi:hypothetical protein
VETETMAIMAKARNTRKINIRMITAMVKKKEKMDMVTMMTMIEKMINEKI